jgi:hypothetical protein
MPSSAQTVIYEMNGYYLTRDPNSLVTLTSVCFTCNVSKDFLWLQIKYYLHHNDMKNKDRGCLRTELRKICRSESEEITAGWRKQTEKLHNFCCLPNIIRVIKSMRVRWAVYVGLKGVWQVHTNIQKENLKRRDLCEDRILLKWILRKQSVKVWTTDIPVTQDRVQ